MKYPASFAATVILLLFISLSLACGSGAEEPSQNSEQVSTTSHITDEPWQEHSPTGHIKLELPSTFERDDSVTPFNVGQDWDAGWRTSSGSVLISLAKVGYPPEMADQVDPRRSIHGSLESLEAAVESSRSAGPVQIYTTEYRADVFLEDKTLDCDTYVAVQVVKTPYNLWLNQIMVCDHVRTTYDKKFTTAVMDRASLP